MERSSRPARISVIIPVSSDTQDLPVLASLKKIDYPADKIEIITSIGGLPSAQRNRAAAVAEGDILYFFNRDSRPAADIFRKTEALFSKDKRIAGVGGPDLTPDDNSYLQHVFGFAMSSYFCHGTMRSRYRATGEERVSSEKELLLSNLAVRKETYLRFNGFNEQLYPNEENELINRISRAGYWFVYHPDIKIFRDRRRNVAAFSEQFFRYGQGRMQQVFIEKSFFNSCFVATVSFSLYLIILVFCHTFYYFLPLFLYLLAALISAARSVAREKRISLFFLLPGIYLTMHISYAGGMLWRALGILCARVKTGQSGEINIKKIKVFSACAVAGFLHTEEKVAV